MEILGLIPARGGSKGIPHKNIEKLGGKPLIAYTCEAARGSRQLTRVILSTDDKDIATLGLALGAEVPFMRPEKLGQDDVPMIEVVNHTLSWLKAEQDYSPEIVVLLQPTSPFRKAEHIDAAIDLLTHSEADSVVSIVEVPHQFNPISVMKLEDGKLFPYISEEGNRVLRRQDKPEVYARNGPAVLASRISAINKTGSLYGEVILPYLMNRFDSIDIDCPEDLQIAELYLKNLRSPKE